MSRRHCCLHVADTSELARRIHLLIGIYLLWGPRFWPGAVYTRQADHNEASSLSLGRSKELLPHLRVCRL